MIAGLPTNLTARRSAGSKYTHTGWEKRVRALAIRNAAETGCVTATEIIITQHDIEIPTRICSLMPHDLYSFRAPSWRVISATSDAVSSQMETASNPSSRRCLAWAPEVQKIAAFLPFACVSFNTFAIAASCSGPPNFTFILLAKSNGPTSFVRTSF